MHEVGIRLAIGRRDLDIRLGDVRGVQNTRQQCHQANTGGQLAELAAGDPPTAQVFVEVIGKMVFVAH
ncbi:hypothetical protein D3C83_188750 [compost metagenome]